LLTPSLPGLRSAIDKRGLRINEEFLSASEAAQQALLTVETQLQQLSACCERMTSALDSCQDSASSLLQSTEALRAELAANERRGALVADFLEKYQLAASEIAALREGDVGGEAFFSALVRVVAIHDNCRALVRRNHQRAGLELMDSMSVHQEVAYERLCRWVQMQCRQLGETELSPEVSPTLQRGMALLHARPQLHRHAAEEAVNVLQQALFGRFIAALTRGGAGGVPRPMEVHAHDPRRYVGDMCAWLHQACASERELVTSLLTAKAAPSDAPSDGSSPDAADASWALDRIFEGVTRPFKLRVESSLAGLPPSALLLAFQVSSLLGFYSATLESLAGSSSVLTRCLADCHDAALRVLLTQLASRKERLARFPPSADADAQPPAVFSEAALRAAELLESERDGGMSSAASTETTLVALIEPLVDAAEKGAAACPRSADAPWLGSVYALNCLALLSTPLANQPVAAALAATLAAAAEQHTAALVSSETSRFLAACGLAAYVELASATPLLPGPALSPAAVSPALEAFYAMLTASSQPLADFRQLKQPTTRTAAIRRVARALADAYECVCDAVLALHPGAVLRFKPAEVRVVCDGL